MITFVPSSNKLISLFVYAGLLNTGDSDFTSVSEVLSFEPSMNVSLLCVIVDIVDDSALEEEQNFLIVLSTADPAIMVQEGLAVIFIVDNEGINCVLLLVLSNLVIVCTLI